MLLSLQPPALAPALDRGDLEQLINAGRTFSTLFPSGEQTWVRQFTTGLLLVLAVVLAVWTFSEFGQSAVSAAELLQASSNAESADLPRPGFVSHHIYTIEARRLPTRVLLTTQHVEVWVDVKTARRARRVFDDKRQLLAGEWTHRDGSRMVYERAKGAPRHETAADPKPLTVHDIWRWEPSTADFTAMVQNTDLLTATASGSGFALMLNQSTGQVEAAELTLDEGHLPIAQRVVLRDSNGGALVEFRTVRDAVTTIPESHVTVSTFEPDPELLPIRLPVDVRSSSSTPPDVRSSISTPAVDVDLAELLATYGLQEVSECLVGGSWRATRQEFRLRAVLATEDCRNQATSSLARLAAMPGVVFDLSVSELPSVKGDNQTTPALGGPDDALGAITLYARLYELYARKGQGAGSQESPIGDVTVTSLIQAFVQRALALLGRIATYATELQRLSDRWSATTLERLGDDGSYWVRLVFKYSSALANETDALIAQLQPVLDSTDTAVQAPSRHEMTIADFLNAPDGSDLARFVQTDAQGDHMRVVDARNAIEELSRRAAMNEASIRQLFSPAPAESGKPDLPLETMLSELRRMSLLARFLSTVGVYYPATPADQF